MNTGDKIRIKEQLGADLGFHLKAGSIGKIISTHPAGVMADFNGVEWFLYFEQFETITLPELEEFQTFDSLPGFNWRYLFAGLSMHAQVSRGGVFDLEKCLRNADSLIEGLNKEEK